MTTLVTRIVICPESRVWIWRRTGRAATVPGSQRDTSPVAVGSSTKNSSARSRRGRADRPRQGCPEPGRHPRRVEEDAEAVRRVAEQRGEHGAVGADGLSTTGPTASAGPVDRPAGWGVAATLGCMRAPAAPGPEAAEGAGRAGGPTPT
jgi:hypothetical protein